MNNPFNPYNSQTVNYSNACNGITGETINGYNVSTKNCDTK